MREPFYNSTIACFGCCSAVHQRLPCLDNLREIRLLAASFCMLYISPLFAAAGVHIELVLLSSSSSLYHFLLFLLGLFANVLQLQLQHLPRTATTTLLLLLSPPPIYLCCNQYPF
jgi:hypothetical protein